MAKLKIYVTSLGEYGGDSITANEHNYFMRFMLMTQERSQHAVEKSVLLGVDLGTDDTALLTARHYAYHRIGDLREQMTREMNLVNGSE